MTEKKPRTNADWVLVERDYRAGIKTLRQMGEEHGVSHVAIQKKAKAEDWTRDLNSRIQQKAAELVNRELVTTLVTKDQKVTERQIVDANANALAAADLTNRHDVLLAIKVSRQHLDEIDALGNPKFIPLLTEMAEQFDESERLEGGGIKVDKANELYKYIISLAGRVKMAKDVAGSIGVYIPMQRKILKLDVDANQNESAVDDVLRRILTSGS